MTDKPTLMQGLAAYLRAEAASVTDDNADTLRIWAREVDAASQLATPATPVQGEPFLWVSPQQAMAHSDPEPVPGYDEGGKYLPVRKTRHGLFTMPLYTRSTAAVAVTDADVDKALNTPIPGGSIADHWFLPHVHQKGKANVRDVVKRMLEAFAASKASHSPATCLPERDNSKPAEQQGLFHKFNVTRTDGSDAPGGKHHGCRYFVLDVDHDAHAAAALAAYASACEATHPELAADLRSKWGASQTVEPISTDTLTQLQAALIIGQRDAEPAPVSTAPKSGNVLPAFPAYSKMIAQPAAVGAVEPSPAEIEAFLATWFSDSLTGLERRATAVLSEFVSNRLAALAFKGQK